MTATDLWRVREMNPSSWFGTGGGSSLQVLWEDGELVFCRGERDADSSLTAALAVLPVAEHPTPATLDRLAREYGLKDELDGAWALRPLDLVREGGRTVLVLEDTRSEPLDRLLGAPMEVRSFLRLAIAVAAAESIAGTLAYMAPEQTGRRCQSNGGSSTCSATAISRGRSMPRERATRPRQQSVSACRLAS
jgi:hypothetical protein